MTLSASRVVGLLDPSGPSDIARLVVPVVINPIQRAVGWPQPDMSKKSGKGIAPFLAHLNTPAAIILPRICVRVVAAVFHILPNTIFSRGVQWAADYGSMLKQTSAGQLFREAPTAFAISRGKGRPPYHFFRSAITFAKEIILLPVFRAALYDLQAAKSGTGFHDMPLAEYNDMRHSKLQEAGHE